MVRLVVTEKIRSAIELALLEEALDTSLAEKLKPYSQRSRSENRPDAEDPDTISHELLNEVSKALLHQRADDDRQDFYFHELVKGSEVYMDKPKPRVKSPELIQLLDAIRADLANKEYAEMVRGVSLNREVQPLVPIGGELRNAFRQISSVINVLFSIAATFAAVFWVSGTVTRDVGMRTLIGLFGALLVAIAEGWFFARDWLFDEPPNPSAKQTRQLNLPIQLKEPSYPNS
ncbi:uncharacterized protein SPPG_00249 [Spizellomyces punctatus DAOM BR117]|uniref:Endoplasmic reticulum-based factor for assembly of V-ATPase n=1 Tax=Spizellomyces punctatus (strain DAOM BR117) TaxID=645134 RepID=A0A0L0HUE3_SPIPD|nr:uncharacterized protein SPPG_00249 [Spizellomyces punctatus DAOM BR117]KND04520.1 hypothetical protein SPPG_00249 [Spizellomyces punctatus DAOM BR117]|eukprot:XP_016612559.1 hypothetical protein SPPG_00249 [Spizellomyces punctatus DAOM BR117]